MSVRTYGFSGFGVIGASLAMALKKEDPECLIIAKAGSEKTIRYALAQRVRNQLRKTPELVFYIDDSLDYIEHIDELLKK